MRSILREQRRSSIAAAAITTLVGLLLVFWPYKSIRLMCAVLGTAIFITGVIYVAGWFSRRKLGVPVVFILPGVILCALGLWLITRPSSVVRLIQYIFGAILIFHGVVDVQSAVALAHQQVKRWWLDVALSIVTIGLGIVILVNPFVTFSALLMLIGLSLIFDGVGDFYLIWRLSRALDDLDDSIW